MKTITKLVASSIIMAFSQNSYASAKKDAREVCGSMKASFNAYAAVAKTMQDICEDNPAEACMDPDYTPVRVAAVKAMVDIAYSRHTVDACERAAARIP